MRFGLTVKPCNISSASAAGYDYVELSVNDILALDESGYRAMTENMAETGIRAEVLKGILPPDIPVIGPRVSSRAIGTAMDQTLELARLLGSELLIFDCPALRKIPHSFDSAEAWRQMGNFIRRLQSWAAAEKIRVALLPMRRAECDMIRRLTEAAMIPSILSLDRVGIAASLYHMSMEADSPTELRNFSSQLLDVHISDSLTDRLPSPGDGTDYARVLHILRDHSCDARVTVTGSATDLENEAAISLSLLKNALLKQV